MECIIGKSDIERCWTFSKDCAKHERPIEYGQEGAHVRDEVESVVDTFIGKLGEVAVQQLLRKKGIETDLDFSTMERGEWDHNDIAYNGWQIDVKCTKVRSRYFLIELNKLQFRADTEELPHFFIMTRLMDPPEAILHKGTCRIEIVGYVDTRELNERSSKVSLLQKGDFIPNTCTLMTTDSFCMSFVDMENDWNWFVDSMQNELPFSLYNYRVPGISEVTVEAPVSSKRKMVQYSLLLAGDAVRKYTVDSVEAYISQGIKCILFVPQQDAGDWMGLKERYSIQNFQLYTVDDGNIPSLEIYDGHFRETDDVAGSHGEGAERDFEALCRLSLSPTFNFEQYRVEHADTANIMIVRAGAGTGKTTVMIDRIMFLLATRAAQMKDIGMVTFTNHATTVMVKRLQERMLNMYELTSDFYWKECLEALGDLQISTIDSFFNNIVKAEGFRLGYGTQIAIKSFIYEKKRILKEIIDDHFREKPVPNLLEHYGMPIHEYVNHAYNLWMKLNSRGYFQEDIYRMDFGRGIDDESEKINSLLKCFIAEAERRYQLFKKKNNAYAISDINADMNALSLHEEAPLERTHFKFLFIDEFQDTDNSQIHSAAWLQQRLHCQLFVVGDIKQSIYRFRGAKETAFDELKRQLMKKGMSADWIREYNLTKNYRTSNEIVEPLNRVFENWGRKDLLEWQAPAVTCVEAPGCFENIVMGKFTKTEVFNRKLVEVVKKWMAISHVCVLVRNNCTVEKFATLCRENEITCIAKLEGGFYRSEPVRDFSALLAALLYPQDNRCLYNLLISPYTCVVPDASVLEKLNGDTRLINDYLNSLLERENWHDYLMQLRYEPVFVIIEKILQDHNPIENYLSFCKNGFPLYGKHNDPEIDAQSYELNLNKLLQILYENFTGEYASLIEIYDFLQNKMNTNTDEDELYPEPADRKSYVECMTVHKAKGDEFETVILPYTRRCFFRDEPDDKNEVLITVNTTDPPRAAWACKCKGTMRCNEWYTAYLDEENDAVRREEARLLYVALTRAKKNLLCFITDCPERDSWDGLLQCREESK